MGSITNQSINIPSTKGTKHSFAWRKRLLGIAVILLLTLMSMSAGAEQDTPDNTGQPTGEKGITPIPVAFYTPETSIGLGGSVILFRNHCRCGERDINDSIAAVAFYTIENQFLAALSGNLYLDNARYHYSPTLAISSFPQKYYGIGNDTANDNEESFTPQYIKLENTFEVRILGYLYAGIVFMQGYYEIMLLDEDGGLEDYFDQRRKEGFYSGAGFNIRRDTRNSSLSPDRGSNTLFTAVFCNAGIMGSYTFSRYLFDHRSYLPAFHSTTMALQFITEAVTGDPPLNYVPKLGGQKMMRGYYQGRFRDNIYIASQVEWRIPLYRYLSAVFFGSAGNVFGRVENIKLRDPKYAGGFGMRIAINRKERINFRIDIGISPNKEVENGFEIKPYFNLLEAF